MTVLRIFLSGDGVCDWRLQPSPNDAQRTPAAGESGARTPFAELPRAARIEAVVPAARMRTLNVVVPPTPAPKLAAVVRFALEDQLAGDVDAQHIVIATQREREALVHIIDRRWLVDTLAQLARTGLRPARLAAESDLAARAPLALATWIWRDDGGFLLEAGGRVTVLDQSDDALPSGLLLALRAGGPRAHADVPSRIVVRGPDQLSARGGAWSRAAGIDFVLEPEWSWFDAPGATIAAAPNLLTPELEAGQLKVRAASRPRLLPTVAGWLLAALLLHAGASAADWAVLTWRGAQVERETLQLIRDGAPALTGDPVPAWRKHYADARHRAGKAAPDDALPLLAEAAVGLPDLPPAALRVISFDAGQLTLDFDRSAAGPIAMALPGWRNRGLAVLQAESPGGLRVRFAWQ